MKTAFCLFVAALALNTVCFGEETNKPVPPLPPAEPVRPVVPGAPENTGYPKFPGFPAPPGGNSQNDGPVREIEKYGLTVTGAFPGGDPQKNAAGTISYSEYILYSNNTAALKINFNNNLRYIYHLRNSRSKTEIRPGVYREIYNTIIQAGNEFLLEQYISELYYDGQSITSMSIFGDNKVVVTMNFTKNNDASAR
jgi:hypothetical protein